MKYKVGDEVTVRSDLSYHGDYEGWGINNDMVKLKGKVVTISSVHYEGIKPYYKLVECRYGWTDGMFEGGKIDFDEFMERLNEIK